MPSKYLTAKQGKALTDNLGIMFGNMFVVLHGIGDREGEQRLQQFKIAQEVFRDQCANLLDGKIEDAKPPGRPGTHDYRLLSQLITGEILRDRVKVSDTKILERVREQYELNISRTLGLALVSGIRAGIWEYSGEPAHRPED